MATALKEASTSSSASGAASRSGVYLQFRELLLSDLPSHPDLPGDRVDAAHFLKQVLDESGPALAAIFDDGPSVKVLSEKASPPADTRVTLRKSNVAFEDLKRAESTGESWVSRESTHVAKAEKWSASYAEFEEGLFNNHMKYEQEYTEDMFDAHLLVEWEGVDEPGRLPKGYTGVQMRLWQAYHKIPVISNRVFNTLVISAKYEDKQLGSFVTLQIPVDLDSFPKEFLDSRSHTHGSKHRKEVSREGGVVKWEEDSEVVLGKYVSIEWVDGVTKPDEVVWRMALISDAGGKLPLALQNMALPGKVSQDVGMFMKWMENRRSAEK